MKLLYFDKATITYFLLLPVVLFSCSTTEKPVTAEEAKDFARQLQSSVEKRNGDFFDQAIDKRSFFKKAGLNDEKEARSFGSGLVDKINIGTQLIRALSKNGTYQLVKQYEKNEKQHVLFRLYDNGSLNYHDIELTRSGKETKIADMFIYASGELFSETINNMFKQMKKIANNNEVNFDDDWVMELPKIRQMMNEGKYSDAMEIYDRLPEKVKKIKAVQITHIMIASGMENDKIHEAVINEYTTLYPNEPNMHLLLLDGYIIKKEYDKALYSINEMDKMINKDPFLDYYRYLIYNLQEDSIQAKTSIETLMKNMPGFEDGMLEIIAVYLNEKNTTGADKWIKEYRLHKSFDQNKLETLLLIKQY